jgi:hypothetical protein
MNIFREEERVVHKVNQSMVQNIFAAVDEIKSDFLCVNNEVLCSFEELQIEVKDKRVHKAMLYELQLLDKRITDKNE